jgi:hypothetical protein
MLILEGLRLCSGHVFTPGFFTLLVADSISRMTRKRKQEIGRRSRGILSDGMNFIRLASSFPMR